MNFELYIIFVLTGFIVSALPGPSIAFTVSQSISHGAFFALPAIMGLFLASILYGLLSVLGIGAFLNELPSISIFIRLSGALFLVYLAYKQFISDAKLEINDKYKKISALKGFIVGMSNPKIMLFYMFFIPQFVDVQIGVSNQLIVLILTQNFIKGSVLVAYALAASKIRYALINKNKVKLINNIASSCILLAALFLFKSVVSDILNNT